MLKPEINELLTQTGPGTAMGGLFREYWIPALLAEELPENDCPPVRVKILSERLIAFRDSNGRYGLIDEFCAHRGASLWFGRNEECGLRCAYHGWKYDVTGQCVEVPSEPENSNFCAKVRLTAYPLVKVGDMLWTHMGDPARRARPARVRVRAGARRSRPTRPSAGRSATGCRPSRAASTPATSPGCTPAACSNDPLFKGSKGNDYNMGDLRPFFEVADAEGGLFVGARRNAEEGTYYWRITPWVMPSFTMVPPRGDHPVHGHFWVPIDDENCWAYTFDYHPVRALTTQERTAMEDGSRRAQREHPRHLPARWPTGTTTT